MARSITSANSIVLLSATNLISVPQQITGYTADNIFTADDLDNKETIMGLDGVLSVGWVPMSFKQHFELQANSTSGQTFFDIVWQSEQQIQTSYPIQGVITLPGIGVTYVMTNGCLRNYKVMPDARRVLQPRPFMIEWERIQIQAF